MTRLQGSRFEALVYALLALLVAGPLLRPGLVLAIDLSQTPRFRLLPSYWGLPAGTNFGSLGRLPFDGLLRLAGAWGVVPVAQKLLLLAIVLLAGLGMHRLVSARLPGRLFAGLLYALNPFVYERLFAGQWFLLLSYALIPWGYRAFLGALEQERWAPWRFAALTGIAGFADPHMSALLLGLCVVTLIARGHRQIAWAALALALAGCASLLWLLPTPGIHELWSHVGHGQLELYATVGDPRWGTLLTVLGLGGFWDDPSPAWTALPVWPAFVVVLLALAMRGTFLVRNRRAAVAVAVCGLVSVPVALGVASSVTRPATLWLMDHLPALRSFRETDKALALLAFAYAYLGSAAVDDLVGSFRRRGLAIAVTALALAVPLVYGGRELFGDWGALRAVEYPASWAQADQILQSQARDSRTLFLPFYGYMHFNFAHSRVTNNPAPWYFSTTVLAGRSVDQDPSHQDIYDPEQDDVASLLRDPARPDLARCLQRLGISHILLVHEVDWARLRGLGRRADMRVVRQWPDLTLIALRRPGALAMTAPLTATESCPRGLRPLASRLVSPVRLRLDGSVAPGRRLVLGLPDAWLWRRSGNDITFTQWPSYRRVYLIAIGGGIVVLASGLVFLVLRRRRRPQQRREPRPHAVAT